MDLKDIQELIKFVAKSGATEVELEIDNVKISIKSPAKKRRGQSDEGANNVVHHITQPSHQVEQIISTSTPQPQVIVNQAELSQTNTQNKTEATNSETQENNNYVTIKASMIGTFYRSPSPEEPTFVNVGDTISKGQTICIIEAMKLFNEIESEISGKVVKVLVDDSQPVEFDQPLFIVDPS
ncbi:acetyl-CoA carboxylase biotin carboxyl carrier protein [Bacteroidota bacterium]|nr:acetyl-CoA carboxylase biotin carboxyl carrier protein [Bacteroidota bacterium]MDC3114775.1 acetyl-CoA carboxylase biotin carboxyl carrier protein [Bacteroidota bacterium]MDC3130127.1 acetyl-CoA carboxylase biotin carboxyl carrier protein [Bacteroidota bacterium]